MSAWRIAVLGLLTTACATPLGAARAETPYAARAAAWALRDECSECADFEVREDRRADGSGAALRWIWGSPTVIYDGVWIQELVRAFGPEVEVWAFAHEYGHWINGYEEGWKAELSADDYAGCALARLGADPEPVLRAMVAISPAATWSHPGFELRRLAVQVGYGRCAYSQ